MVINLRRIQWGFESGKTALVIALVILFFVILFLGERNWVNPVKAQMMDAKLDDVKKRTFTPVIYVEGMRAPFLLYPNKQYQAMQR